MILFTWAGKIDGEKHPNKKANFRIGSIALAIFLFVFLEGGSSFELFPFTKSLLVVE